MATRIELVEFIGGHSVLLEAGSTDVEATIIDAGYIPSGYFWERVAVWLIERDDVPAELSLECSANLFSASGLQEPAEKLREKLVTLTADSAALRSLIDDAKAHDFTLEF
ncbi:hypothetical protein QP027_10990 [Corynebacterium breve]|uniref:Immunity protein 51 n=1 Tax=Corynebacterium breve TaxID=3049799 RepID=A0ABY8VF54_9CORY|nr:hypothetical protein [Corynebacterium breve]WIM67596.1 hypothetical protein QP027_10990 [Corynebacterium breve]